MYRNLLVVALVAVVGCEGRVASPLAPAAVQSRGEGILASRYANATYVASRGFIQPLVLTRNANGLATSFHATREIWAPALYKYTVGPYVVKEQRDVKEWTLCIMDANATIAPQAGNDPDVQVIPDKNLTAALTGQKLAATNAWLSLTDFGVTATTGQTVLDVLTAVLVALGHSPDAPGEL